MARAIAKRHGAAVGEPGAKKVRKPAVPSHLEETLVQQINQANLPPPEREQLLIPGRKFKCDLVWRPRWLVVEVEGAVHTHGRHTRGAGFERDAVKYNLLTLLGWNVIRVTSTHIKSGQAVRWIEQALQQRRTEVS